MSGGPMVGTVYFLRSPDGMTKIGWTREKKPDRRIAEIQRMNGSRLHLIHHEPGTRDTELQLHRLFAEHREHGEWFRLPEDWRSTAAALLRRVESQEDLAAELLHQLEVTGYDVEIDVEGLLDVLACGHLQLERGGTASTAYFRMARGAA